MKLILIFTLLFPFISHADICKRTTGVVQSLEGLLHKDCAQITNDDLYKIEIITFIPAAGGKLNLKSDDFQGLTRLKKIYLENRVLSALPSDLFKNLNSLEFISFKSSVIDQIPPNLFNGLYLKTLDFQYARVGQIFPDSFNGLDINYLSLSNVGINEIPSVAFKGLRAKSISLDYNKISKLPPDAFDGTSGIEELSLRDNNIASLPRNIFSNLKGLRTLLLDRNPLGVDVSFISKLTELEYLSLSETNMGSYLTVDGFKANAKLSRCDLRFMKLAEGILKKLEDAYPRTRFIL